MWLFQAHKKGHQRLKNPDLEAKARNLSIHAQALRRRAQDMAKKGGASVNQQLLNHSPHERVPLLWVPSAAATRPQSEHWPRVVDVIEDEYSNLSSVYHEWYWKNPFQTAASWDHLCFFKKRTSLTWIDPSVTRFLCLPSNYQNLSKAHVLLHLLLLQAEGASSELLGC